MVCEKRILFYAIFLYILPSFVNRPPCQLSPQPQRIKHAETSTVNSIIRSTEADTLPAIRRSEKQLISVVSVTRFSNSSPSQRTRRHRNMCTPATAPDSMTVREAIPQEIMEALNLQRVKSKAHYDKNKEKLRLRDQARRNDPVQYEVMKERSKQWNRKRYQEMKTEDYVCACGAHIKRVSLHSHLVSKKHLNNAVVSASKMT
jgi:hypothetical protein